MGSIPPAMVGEEGWGGGGEVRCEMECRLGTIQSTGIFQSCAEKRNQF